jgi:hypothetical protein
MDSVRIGGVERLFRRSRAYVGLAAFAMCLALSGCELWLNVDIAQCTTDKRCIELLGLDYTCGPAGTCVSSHVESVTADPGSALPARWACIDDPPKSYVPKSDKTIHIRMSVVDFATLEVPDALSGDACSPSDVGCDTPVVGDVTASTDGYFDFDLPYGFQGFFRFTSSSFVPGFMYTNRPWLQSETASGPSMISPKGLKDLIEHAATGDDPSRGVAIIESRDCNDVAGAGVSFENGRNDQPFYFDGALPSRDLEATTESTVLGAGRERRAVGGFSNLQPGYATFVARLASTGDEIGKVTTQIRGGYLSYMRIYPGY